jgi:hypothetical protein
MKERTMPHAHCSQPVIYGYIEGEDENDNQSSAFNPTPLPIEEDLKEILSSRPGDQIYQTVKDHIETVKTQSKEYKEKLLALILKDMYLDLAVSTAIDDAGATAEYLAQELGIEKPLFKGDHLLMDFSRISKFKTSVELGKLLELNDEEMGLMMREEATRLWCGGTGNDKTRPSNERREPPTILTLPDDVVQLLRRFTRGRDKKDAK